METRVVLLGIIVEDTASVEALNARRSKGVYYGNKSCFAWHYR